MLGRLGRESWIPGALRTGRCASDSRSPVRKSRFEEVTRWLQLKHFLPRSPCLNGKEARLAHSLSSRIVLSLLLRENG